ncbi:hypothetical protein CEXT_18921 [Caerostris extrusa]|uniref:Uncharacterized protein n=1 Tax=Caerostris extrusa TaxID=172846 RepID=A0AAV4VEN2_CAEEX|nr:hypothetical protein CEXT_18921 [Caerostris extrusa]
MPLQITSISPINIRLIKSAVQITESVQPHCSLPAHNTQSLSLQVQIPLEMPDRQMEISAKSQTDWLISLVPVLTRITYSLGAMFNAIAGKIYNQKAKFITRGQFRFPVTALCGRVDVCAVDGQPQVGKPGFLTSIIFARKHSRFGFVIGAVCKFVMLWNVISGFCQFSVLSSAQFCIEPSSLAHRKDFCSLGHGLVILERYNAYLK